MPTPDSLPLIFDFIESVFSDDYSVQVRVRAKAVVLKEKDGETSVYGVVPAGPTGAGDSLESAMRSFRSDFRETLANLGRWSDSWEDFRATFNEYFGTTPAHLERLWDDALENVKSFDREKLDLPVKSEYAERGVTIQGTSLTKKAAVEAAEEAAEEVAIAA